MKVRVVLASLFLLLIIISSPSVVCEARDEDPNIEIAVVVGTSRKSISLRAHLGSISISF